MKTVLVAALYSIMQYFAELFHASPYTEGLTEESETIKALDIREERVEQMTEQTVETTVAQKAEPIPAYAVYSKEHLQELKKLFPLDRWVKGKSIEELAFSAGQQSVIDKIEARLNAEGRKVHVLR